MSLIDRDLTPLLPRLVEISDDDAVRDGFGTLHLHSGLGIRCPQGNYFECRAGIKLRLVFRARGGVLYFITAGNHDEVETFMKSL